MKKQRSLLFFTLSMLLFFTTSVLFILSQFEDFRACGKYIIITAVSFLVFYLVCILNSIARKKGLLNNFFKKAFIIFDIFCLLILLTFSVLSFISSSSSSDNVFSSQTTLYSNKNVMVIVPHQDDDINLVGGIIEQYTKNGSNVSIVFTSSRDFWGKTKIREDEALDVLTYLGVPKENIYFTGFGGDWQKQTQGNKEISHIYHSPSPDTVWTTRSGRYEYSDTNSASSYQDIEYTRQNFLYVLQSIIEEQFPDTIFAVDYDSNIEHRAADLFFEEVICNVLRKFPDYKPTVYKGFCYGTAWTAPYDYYDSLNLLSTKHPSENTWALTGTGYLWEDRVRFPLGNENLNNILSKTSVYKSLEKYHSQSASSNAPKILNGDKVFWLRRTDSLLYKADIFLGDRKTTVLNDFKLKDSNNLRNSSAPESGVEFVEDKTVRVNLNNQVKSNCIYLYDNPDEKENILGGFITFDNGTIINFDSLEKGGAATIISFPEVLTETFEITFTKKEGSFAGLSEIELYYDVDSSENETSVCIMPVDSEDNFAYDYIIDKSNFAEFTICTVPHVTPLTSDSVSVSLEPTTTCSYVWKNDRLIIYCPEGDRCKITLSYQNTSTTFSVSNPSRFTKIYLQSLRIVDAARTNFKLLAYSLKNVALNLLLH